VLLVLPVLLLVVVGVLLAAGVIGSSERARPRLGCGVVAAVAGVVVALALAVAGLFGLDGTVSEKEAAPSTSTTVAPAPAAGTALARPPRLPRVDLDRAERERGSVPGVLDGLPADGVVVVRAVGFGWVERGRVELCTPRAGRPPACTGAFPVQFDEDGDAEVQYLLPAAVVPGGCRAGGPTCLIRVTGDDDARWAARQVVLVDRVGPARVAVTPSTGLREGAVIEVRVRGLTPGTRATAAVCTAPGLGDLSGCREPTPGFTADSSGAGVIRLALDEATPCGPRRGCAVVVLSGNGFVAAPAFPVRFSLGPGPRYHGGRLGAGLLVAAVFLGIALALVRTTDWGAPSEGSTPELDGADLETERNLDELFGTDEELDAAYPTGVS